MGQQQLLLILIGVIAVGLAIVVGINIFNNYKSTTNRDAIVGDLNNLGSHARKYFIETRSLGGGDQSFTGWTITTGLTSNDNGGYSASVTSNLVTIVGTGTQPGNDGTNPVKVTDYVTSTKDSIVINN